MLIELIIAITCISIFISVYSFLKSDKVKNIIDYIIESKKYLDKLNQDKTIFIKRLDNLVYIEYGIEKIFILDIENDIFDFIDYKTNKRINSRFKFLNNILISKTFEKHQNKINDCIDFNKTLLDRKTHDLMQLIIDITVSSLKENKENKEISKDVENTKENIDFDIDDILDKINKVGYNNLTDKEKEFLKNYN